MDIGYSQDYALGVRFDHGYDKKTVDKVITDNNRKNAYRRYNTRKSEKRAGQ